jgi:hypothetical protein
MSIRSGMSNRAALVALLAAVTVLVPATAAAKHKPGGGGGGGTFSTTSTYVKNYANLVGGVETELTPRDVQATPDGGWIALGSTSTQNGAGVGLLVKASPVGAPQWQEELGCLNGAPGDYAEGASLQLTSDGGYVLAGGTIGCGSGSVCPELSGIQCGLVEKLDSTGRLLWSRAYTANVGGTTFDAIRQTSDGGYVVAGSASDSGHRPGALVVKLDASGNVQWQRELGPTSTRWALLQAVRQSADGGYVAAGTFNDGSTDSSGSPRTSVLAIKLDAAGNLVWERGFNDVASGALTATEHVDSLEQTSDGGYAIGGDWSNSDSYGDCCQGALLLELASDGSLRSQQAYSGGVRCISTGFGVQCVNLGGSVYSVRRTSDGGFVLAGQGSINLSNESPLVPWLAKVDATGAIVWQENITQVTSTGGPLSQYFAAAALTPTGPIAIGSTENYSKGLNELLGAQTDAGGAAGTCSQIRPGTVLSAINPGLVPVAPGFTAQAAPVSSQSSSAAQTLATTASATAPQC